MEVTINIDAATYNDIKDGYTCSEYADEILKLVQTSISGGSPVNGWIPVSERLPNRNGVYNVTRKLKEGETIYFISDASYFDGQNTWHNDTGINHGRPYLTDVIAWQQLPEPYKKGGAEC